jgi:hypothetical protein
MESLYSYRRISDFLFENFKNNQLYLNVINRMNDPYEGSINMIVNRELIDDFYVYISKWVNLPTEMVLEIDKIYDIEKKMNLLSRIFETSVERAVNEHMGIFCLTTNRNSLPMWGHYADNHKGILIEFDATHPIMLKASKVNYSEKINDVIIKEKSDFSKLDSIIYNSLMTKHNSWRYENEYRIRGRAGDVIKYDSKLIKAIYFGMQISCEDKEKLKKANAHNHNIKYYDSVMMTGTYRVNYL